MRETEKWMGHLKGQNNEIKEIREEEGENEWSTKREKSKKAKSEKMETKANIS